MIAASASRYVELIDKITNAAHLHELYLLKTQNPHKFRRSKENSLIYKKLKEITLLKAIGHSTHQAGIVSLKLINKAIKTDPLSVDLEGGDTAIWMRKMSKATDLMICRYPSFLSENAAYLLSEMLSFAESPQLPNAVVERISKGLPTLVNTGFNIDDVGHAVTLFFWGDYYALCNLGAEFRMPVEFFLYQRNLMTVDILQSIMGVKEENIENYKRVFFDELPIKLGLSQAHIEKVKERLFRNFLQIINNCSWVSPEISILVFFFLYQLYEGEGNLFGIKMPLETEIQAAINKAKPHFDSWCIFNQLYHLDRYMTAHILREEKSHELNKTRNIYQIDRGVIENAFCYSLPTIQEKNNFIYPEVVKDWHQLHNHYQRLIKPITSKL